jgi:hypothetical protein
MTLRDMNTPTPDTDSFFEIYKIDAPSHLRGVEFCRKLECQRNAAIEALRKIAEIELEAENDVWSALESIGAVAHNFLATYDQSRER